MDRYKHMEIKVSDDIHYESLQGGVHMDGFCLAAVVCAIIAFTSARLAQVVVQVEVRVFFRAPDAEFGVGVEVWVDAGAVSGIWVRILLVVVLGHVFREGIGVYEVGGFRAGHEVHSLAFEGHCVEVLTSGAHGDIRTLLANSVIVLPFRTFRIVHTLLSLF